MGNQLIMPSVSLSFSLLLQERHQLSGALSSLGLEHQLNVEVAGDAVRAQAAAPGPRVAFTFESQEGFSCNPPQQPSGGTILKWKQLLHRGWKVRRDGDVDLCARPEHFGCTWQSLVCNASSTHTCFAAAQRMSMSDMLSSRLFAGHALLAPMTPSLSVMMHRTILCHGGWYTRPGVGHWGRV